MNIYILGPGGSFMSADELYHKENYKYTKREWKGGKWVYTYPSDAKKSTGAKASKEYLEETAYNSKMNTYLTKGSSSIKRAVETAANIAKNKADAVNNLTNNTASKNPYVSNLKRGMDAVTKKVSATAAKQVVNAVIASAKVDNKGDNKGVNAMVTKHTKEATQQISKNAGEVFDKSIEPDVKRLKEKKDLVDKVRLKMRESGEILKYLSDYERAAADYEKERELYIRTKGRKFIDRIFYDADGNL